MPSRNHAFNAWKLPAAVKLTILNSGLFRPPGFEHVEAKKKVCEAKTEIGLVVAKN